jgi:hypothetical protein
MEEEGIPILVVSKKDRPFDPLDDHMVERP